MKKWVFRNKLYALGAILGAVAGFLYWKYIGCLTGTCVITSNPLKSTLYFSLMGGLVFGIFKKSEKKQPEIPSKKEI